MNERDFSDLLMEIDTMTVDQYKKYHEIANRMKKSNYFISDIQIFNISSVQNISLSISSEFMSNSTMGLYSAVENLSSLKKEESSWQKAA